MSKFIIQGGKPLSGSIIVAGNKNAILPIMAATLLVSGDITLTNVPRIIDVVSMADILISLGAKIEGIGTNTLFINTDAVNSYSIRSQLTNKLRASVLLLGPLFSRFGKVDLAHPGGDVIGKRSIDTHLQALSKIGATIEVTKSMYRIRSSKKRLPEEISIFLDEPTVTGTENIIMASVFIKSPVFIENAACEPHVVDLISFLKKCGAKIEGSGTHKITIQGKELLRSCSYRIVSDYLEAGTFAVLSALTGCNIAIRNVQQKDIELPLRILHSMNIEYKIADNVLTVNTKKILYSQKRVQAAPHPGFPTDLMSPFIVLGTQAHGETLFHDPLYESRMFFVDKLIGMGAQITICDPHRVIVNGPTKLHGSYQASPDIRAGIALVIAALIAEGESIIDHAEIIERGYESLAERLSKLGADIRKDG